jgi:ABC-type multidrug transport system fused ATPase/permease subunit
VGLAWALSVLHALLVVALLTTLGLLADLAVKHGEVDLPRPLPGWIPTWVAAHVDDVETPGRLIDGGLAATGIANRASDSFLEQQWGRLLLALTRWVPPLRFNTGALLCLMAVGLLLVLARALTSQALADLVIDLPATVATSLRRQVHRQMFRLGQSALPSEGIESVTDLFTRSTDEIEKGLRADFNESVRAPALMIALLLMSLVISWPLALALLTLAVLTELASRPLRARSRRISESAGRNAQVQMRLLQEDLGLARTVRVFGMESVGNRRFDEHLDSYNQAVVRQEGASAWAGAGAAYLLAATAAVLGFGLMMIALLRPVPMLSPAAALVLVLALAGLVPTIRSWRASHDTIRHASRVATYLYDFLGRKPELYQTSGANFLAPLNQRITFENVSLTTPSGKDLLEDVNVEIQKGSRVAIMGRDEEAKHAFVCLIPRLIDPKQGRVRIDGQDLKNVTLESLRAQIAMVLSNDLIFSDSVAANIGLGDQSFTLPRIIEAAKIAHAHNFIQDLPNGYDTIVGPLGHFLRVDEQYRIALARVYLHDPSIVIIEEPNGALDDEIKPLIDDTIQRLSKARTLIFLPHRLSTIRSCDQIIILHNGRLESVGTPKELQHASKVFRHLQYMEFNQFAAGDIEAGQMGV